MPRDPRYDILFEPVRIGPVTAKNRFFQVPHCNGMGYRDATAMAAMREVKAEGGWGVVCTEQAEIHHTADITPFIELRLWDDHDIPCWRASPSGACPWRARRHRAGLHRHERPNLYTREIPLGPADMPIITFYDDPVQARAMDKDDIRNLRRWHGNAAVRAKRPATTSSASMPATVFGAPMHFLSRRHNTRTDEYGGSLANRVRLLREIIEDTKDAVGDRCAVACASPSTSCSGEAGCTRRRRTTSSR